MGDQVVHGSVVKGSITEGSPTQKADGLSVARIGDRVTCSDHPGPQTIVGNGGGNKVDGKEIAVHNSTVSCGATIRVNSGTTYAEKP